MTNQARTNTTQPTDTALIGLDYIVDIMHPDGLIARAARLAADRDVVGRFNDALATAAGNGWLTVLVKVGFQPGYPELPATSPMFAGAGRLGALRLDGPGTAFHPELDVDRADLVVSKPRVSAFYGTALDAALRANNIRRLVLAGVSSSWAVQSTARDAHDRDLEVVVLEDACAAATEREHHDSMQLLGTIATITSTARLADLAA